MPGGEGPGGPGDHGDEVGPGRPLRGLSSERSDLSSGTNVLAIGTPGNPKVQNPIATAEKKCEHKCWCCTFFTLRNLPGAGHNQARGPACFCVWPRKGGLPSSQLRQDGPGSGARCVALSHRPL